MKNFNNYKKGYYMPPEKCLKWVEKDAVEKSADRTAVLRGTGSSWRSDHGDRFIRRRSEQCGIQERHRRWGQL